ncbi:inner membrane transporter RhtA [Nocardioides cavernae]|uniref:Inner membrane transporter RhtA n=1 Tax=Nocardioides cavernae TaxID=1921566 RepID=A0A7Y9H1X7_9ACTN|nr:EamA family transporter [Nocardioides cavernae]NYE36243.1 inner membrane transporter RhtA [Nocardioides cavernae]
MPPTAEQLRPLGVAAGLVLCASLAVQGSAVLSHAMFADLGAGGVSGLRFLLAALLALVLVRPRWRGRDPAAWAWIAVYGTVIAVMNLAMYRSLEHLPLGVAVTIELCGPLALGATRLPHPALRVFPVVSLAGLVLVARPGGGLPLTGLALAGCAALGLAAYAVVAERISATSDGNGWEELALALVVAAAWTLPLTAGSLPDVEAGHLPRLAVAAAFGVLLAFGLDFLAVRVSSARVVAVLLSFDPVLGAVLGWLFMAQDLGTPTLLGIALVVSAGVVTCGLHGAAAGGSHGGARRVHDHGDADEADQRPGDVVAVGAEAVGDHAPRE